MGPGQNPRAASQSVPPELLGDLLCSVQSSLTEITATMAELRDEIRSASALAEKSLDEARKSRRAIERAARAIEDLTCQLRGS